MKHDRNGRHTHICILYWERIFFISVVLILFLLLLSASKQFPPLFPMKTQVSLSLVQSYTQFLTISMFKSVHTHWCILAKGLGILAIAVMGLNVVKLVQRWKRNRRVVIQRRRSSRNSTPSSTPYITPTLSPCLECRQACPAFHLMDLTEEVKVWSIDSMGLICLFLMTWYWNKPIFYEQVPKVLRVAKLFFAPNIIPWI